MGENIRLAFRGIWTHKMRSFLTMLGIIIGIAAIIAIVSTIEGTNQQIKENLIGSGSNTVDVELYQDEWSYDMSSSGIPSGIYQVTDQEMEDILAIDTVKSASRYLMRQVYDGVYVGNTSFSGYVRGVEDNYFVTDNLTVKEGRLWNEEDKKAFAKVCLLDSDAVKSLFSGEDPLGQVVEISGQPFRVIGVVASRRTFEPTINSLNDYYTYNDGVSSGNIYLPIEDWGIIYNYDEPENVLLRATSTDDMTSAGKDCAEVLNANIAPEDETIKYQPVDLLEQATQLQQLSSSTNNMLIWIAAISLLVGGIGVMNIMLVSVTERTGEIGLKKAIGARKSKIMVQFLTEAVVLTSMGGIFGVLSGIGLAQIISYVSGTPVAISIPAVVVSVAFSMVIGIIFGLLPSRQAANLNPIDALRHE